jgi:hypothetical protein
MMKKAQSTIEFTFAMIAIMFLAYGMVMVFRWAGMDLAQRRYAQDTSLTNLNTTNCTNSSFSGFSLTPGTCGDPASQLNSDTDSVLPISAVYRGNVTNGNTAQ